MTNWPEIVVGSLSVAVATFALWQGRRANASSRASADAAKTSALAAAKSADAAQTAAVAAAETARIDREQWHQQRTPKLSVRFEHKGSKGHEIPGIAVANIGNTDCETVDVTLEAAGGFRQAIASLVITSGGSPGPWQIVKLNQGHEQWHQVSPPDPHGGRTIVRCACRNAMGEEWIVALPLDSLVKGKMVVL